MATIKFSHDYPKLWGQNKAELIEVVIISQNEILDKDLIEYDTKNSKGDYYQLPNDDLIQLVFVGNKRIPFCTLRRFTREKYNYYKNLIGELFEIKITSNFK